MTLFTAEGLIRARVRWHARGICHAPSVVHHALLRWLETQGEAGRTSPLDRIGLTEDPRLHHRRAPGLTCLSALCDSRRFGDPTRNDSKGCGAIMRVAPIGLMCRPDRIDEMADECSHLTHGHRTGRDSARAFAHLLSLVLHGASLAQALDRVQAMDLDHATLAAIRAARIAPPDGRPETVETLGGGWVAEEALAIALYAARVGTGFRHGLRIALTHSGDSDSTAAIAGNLLGLIYPEEALTHPLCTQIEGADLIERITCDLHACTQPGDDFAERMRDRYPGC